MDQGRDWATHLTFDVGKRIAEYRTARGLSGQQLADRCAELGMPGLNRQVITKLENRRREAISLAELLVLARALDTSPVLLALSIGKQQSTEVLPGQSLGTWDAALWLAGEVQLSDAPDGLDAIWLDWTDAEGVVPLHHRHDQLVNDLSGGGLWSIAVDFGEDGQPDPVETLKLQRGIREELENDLHHVRSRMRELGLNPPQLTPELAYIDQQERHRSGRRGTVSTRGPGVDHDGGKLAGTAQHQQPVVAAIVTSRLGVLVGRRNDGIPPWTFIAGEVEPGEQPEDAAVREVKEETGCLVRAAEKIGERVHPKTGRTMIYMAAAPTHGTDVFVGDRAELAEVRWVSLAEADELLPGMYEPVREYLARTLGQADGPR